MTACSKPDPRPVAPYVPADLLTPCETPAMQSTTEGQLARKTLRIAADRDCANAKISAIAEILATPAKGK